MERWNGRVAVVTGASAGIGAAVAKALASRGMKVVGVARRPQLVQQLSEESKAEGASGEIFAQGGDVSVEEDVKRIVGWTRDNLGGVDVLVNNAGVAPLTLLSELDVSAMRSILDINVIGLSIFTREAIQDMKARGVDDGHIIHINSIFGHQMPHAPELAGYAPYVASKHAVSLLTEALRRELRNLGTKIRITSVSPGFVQTDLFRASGQSELMQKLVTKDTPILHSEDVADAVVFAISAPPHVQIHELTLHPTGEKC